MREPISLKAERETLIIVMKELISAKDRLDSISEGNTDIADLYRGKLIDIGMDIGDICVELGGMVGCTVYSDLCEGLEVLP